jgi:hypothetical protein
MCPPRQVPLAGALISISFCPLSLGFVYVRVQAGFDWPAVRACVQLSCELSVMMRCLMYISVFEKRFAQKYLSRATQVVSHTHSMKSRKIQMLERLSRFSSKMRVVRALARCAECTNVKRDLQTYLLRRKRDLKTLGYLANCSLPALKGRASHVQWFRLEE